MLILLLKSLLLSGCISTDASNHAAQQKLFFELNKNSYAMMAPYFAYSGNAKESKENISFEPLKIRIAGVEEKQQTIQVVMTANVTWCDYRLAWNTSEYNGINKVVLTRESIWRPHINPCKYVSLESDDNEKGLVMVSSEGNVQDIVTWNYVAPVKVELHKFPFDEHTLEICFDSQALMRLNVKVEGSVQRIQTSDIEVGDEWKITQKLKLITTNPSNASVYFNITVKRHSAFWVHLIIIPCFILGFLIIAGLVLNTDSTTIESVVNFFFGFFQNPFPCEYWPCFNCVNCGGNINDDG